MIMKSRSKNILNGSSELWSKYILLDVLLCSIAEYFYELCRILMSPQGESKYKQRLGLLSNKPNCYVCAGELRGYLFTENAWQKYIKRNGIGAGNSANWLVNSRRTRQSGFCGFDHAITGPIYFTFYNGKKIVFPSSKLQINSTFSL